MNKLSTGGDSTLGNWLILSKIVFGQDSPAVHFIEEKIKEAPMGEREEVLANEQQLIGVLIHLHTEGNAAGLAGDQS